MPDEGRNGFSYDDLSKKLEAKIESGITDSFATGEMIDLSTTDITTTVKHSPTAIVLFYREECPYCKKLTPLLEDLAEEYENKVLFAKANIDTFGEIKESYRILGVPVVIAFKKGLQVARIDGLQDMDVYDQWIESIRKGIRPMGFDTGPNSTIT